MPEPKADESLLGFVTRALSETAIVRTVHGLKLAGIERASPWPIPSGIKEEEVERLATLLQTTPDHVWRMTHSVGTFSYSRTETIGFFGISIRSEYREKRIRRVSPRALAKSPYHRAIWDLRVFSFDPETREQLLERCPECRKPLGWLHARGVQVCDHCIDPKGSPTVWLPDYPQPLIEVEDSEALDFVTGLVSPDNEKRLAARSKAVGPWARFDGEVLFESCIAFACALTMSPDLRRTTLERAKETSEYKRFTPEVLAMAGRAIIGGTNGFTAVADRIRADAAKRPGFYGLNKELGPLFCMMVDPHVHPEVKRLLKISLSEDMRRPGSAGAVRRADYAGDDEYLSLGALADLSGIPRRSLGWLSNSGMIPVIQAEDAALSPKLMPVKAVMSLVAQYRDSLHESLAGAILEVKPHVLTDLVRRGLIEEVSGTVLGLLKGPSRYFSKSSVEELKEMIWWRAESGGSLNKSVPIAKAAKQLNVTPVPWGAVIAAIVKGAVTICVRSGDDENWMTGVGVSDQRAFRNAVFEEVANCPTIAMGEWISASVVADVLGVNCATAFHILSDSENIPAGDRISRQHLSGPNYSRADVERFSAKYIFAPEIQRRAALARARDVRLWLEQRGVSTAFRLQRNRMFGYLREKVETVLRDGLKMAAE